jgi:hypothetical protein
MALSGLFGHGRAAFLIPNAVMQNHPDQVTEAMRTPGGSGERAGLTLDRVSGYRRSHRRRDDAPFIRSITHAPDQTYIRVQHLHCLFDLATPSHSGLWLGSERFSWSFAGRRPYLTCMDVGNPEVIALGRVRRSSANAQNTMICGYVSASQSGWTNRDLASYREPSLVGDCD